MKRSAQDRGNLEIGGAGGNGQIEQKKKKMPELQHIFLLQGPAGELSRFPD